MKDVIFVHLLLIFCDEISQLCNQFIFLVIDRSCSFIVNYKVLIDMLFGNTKQCIKCVIKVIICFNDMNGIKVHEYKFCQIKGG